MTILCKRVIKVKTLKYRYAGKMFDGVRLHLRIIFFITYIGDIYDFKFMYDSKKRRKNIGKVP